MNEYDKIHWAKEKANDLYDKFFDTEILDITKAHKKAKKYALITIDEVLRNCHNMFAIQTWERIKAELHKI